MATTLTNIQTDVRFWAQDQDLVITSGDNLRRANEVYQGIFTPGYTLTGLRVGMRWPERIREHTSLATVSGTPGYNWPSSPVFLRDDAVVELQEASGGAVYRQLDLIADEAEDLALRNSSNTIPSHYRWLMDTSGTALITLRPTPSVTGLTIRIRGETEATAFTAGTSETEFTNINHDKALAMLIAAVFKMQRGDPGYAQALVANAKGLLPKYDTSPWPSAGKLIAHYL